MSTRLVTARLRATVQQGSEVDRFMSTYAWVDITGADFARALAPPDMAATCEEPVKPKAIPFITAPHPDHDAGEYARRQVAQEVRLDRSAMGLVLGPPPADLLEAVPADLKDIALRAWLTRSAGGSTGAAISGSDWPHRENPD